MREVLQKLESIEALLQKHTAMLHKLTGHAERLALLHSLDWPQALDPLLMCDKDSQQDKLDRAEGIIETMIDLSLSDSSFLDFGCGEGHVVARVDARVPKKAVGYDISPSMVWDDLQGMYTTEWTKVEENGPYDAILIYDVLDHVDERIDVYTLMGKINQVLAPTGKVYVRCHPWCSRHGTHLYHQINKAYVHLVFSEEQLADMGYKAMPTRKIIHPLGTYNSWFKDFSILHQYTTKEAVDPFFLETPVICDAIKEKWRESKDKELRRGLKMPHFQMEQQFLDFVLSKKRVA